MARAAREMEMGDFWKWRLASEAMELRCRWWRHWQAKRWELGRFGALCSCRLVDDGICLKACRRGRYSIGRPGMVDVLVYCQDEKIEVDEAQALPIKFGGSIASLDAVARQARVRV